MMKRTSVQPRFIVSVFLIYIFYLITSVVLPSHVNAQTIKPITAIVINNASYPSLLGKGAKVTLKDGEYRGNGIYVDLDDKAFGDLNGDKIDDAVVIVKGSTGGSGYGLDLYAAIASKGNPMITEPVPLGQVQIKSLRIDNGNIVIDLLTHRVTGDPNCCPSLKSTVIYAVKNGQVVKVKGKIVNWGREVK